MNHKQTVNQFLQECSAASLLKNAGYKKSRLTWAQRTAFCTRVVDFQVSQWSDDRDIQFTINTGISIETSWMIYFGQPSPRFINEADCFPRLRIGDLIDGTDRWWKISAGQTPASVGDDVLTALSKTCLPALDKLNSIDSVVSFLNDYPAALGSAPFTRIMFAIVLYLDNRLEDADAELLLVEQNRRLGPTWTEKIREVRSRLSTYS
ncbi:MAG: DUF4304 domain-containing protein [Planctomycetota bacterium]